MAGVKPHCLTGGAAMSKYREYERRIELLGVDSYQLRGEEKDGLRIAFVDRLHM
jgi:hypothetical protein